MLLLLNVLTKVLLSGAPDKLKQSGYKTGGIFEDFNASQSFKEEQNFDDDDDMEDETAELLEEVLLTKDI
jgi:hypothetical protein